MELLNETVFALTAGCFRKFKIHVAINSSCDERSLSCVGVGGSALFVFLCRGQFARCGFKIIVTYLDGIDSAPVLALAGFPINGTLLIFVDTGSPFFIFSIKLQS